ncbi:MAG: SAM-dependent methyltransferase [Clostridia bacterium]|nr:SAM-dependent methyltransferase [Clostridia bacterium]
MPNEPTPERLTALLSDALERRIFKKAVFSKPEDKSVLKTVASLYKKSDGSVGLRIERFTKDNKAYQQNLPTESAEILANMALREYRQTNLFTTAGDIEIRRSKSGSAHMSGRLSDDADEAEVRADGKRYIIDPSRDVSFLHELGLADANGRIHDKKQPKFRQINRFLELVRDIEDRLTADRPAVICDLCCGKSYLTFAVYYYFTVIKKQPVIMYGIDLKADVIAYCSKVAARQHFDNLHFVSGNINEYTPPQTPDMVISLHACDIATDIVLANAVKWGARTILSTPCCHHEMAKQLAVPADNAPMRSEMDFILQSPILRQRFCDAATDALRVKRLESMGYRVTTLELIDPDDTPKNLMIRAVLDERISAAKCEEALDEYRRITAALGVDPFLDNLLRGHEES